MRSERANGERRARDRLVAANGGYAAHYYSSGEPLVHQRLVVIDVFT
jgi:hypothetical protein